MHTYLHSNRKSRSTSRSFYWVLPLVVCGWFGIANSVFSMPAKNLNPIILKLEEHIQQQIQKKRIPGCAIAIIYNNEVAFMKGYGSRILGKNEKIDVDTVFQLGSVSKPVAATLATILENKGMLRFDDPINFYLPNFSLNSKQPANALKIKHILSHSTGVPRAGFNNLIEAHASFPKILVALKNTPVRTPVGRRYDYNNAMYSVISEVTKSATQLSFSDALRLNLLQPLKMTRTSATYEGLLRTENRASPHTRNARGALVPCDTYSKGYYNVAPAGGINSSVRDMATFIKAQMGGYPHVLNHRSLSRIQAPQIITNGMLQSNGPRCLIKNPRYALGWRVVDFADQKMVFHGGWLKGFTNFVAFMPEQSVGIVVLHNGDTKFSSGTGVKFFELLFEVPQKKIRKDMMGVVAAINAKKLTRCKSLSKCKKINKPKINLKAKNAKNINNPRSGENARCAKSLLKLKNVKTILDPKKIGNTKPLLKPKLKQSKQAAIKKINYP